MGCREAIHVLGMGRRRTPWTGAVPAGAVRLGAMTVSAMHAHRAVPEFLSQHRSELERRTQLHVHCSHQVILAEQWQRRPVDGLFSKTL